MKRLSARRDLYWGYVAQLLNVGGSLLLLPVVLHCLSVDDVGLWFVFTTLASLAQLLELGFQPTIARNAAYIFAGAQRLEKTGLPISEKKRSAAINLNLLSELVKAAQYIYRLVAIVAVFTLLVGGSLYILTVITKNQDSMMVIVAWSLFSFGCIANFYYGYINGLLQGKGEIIAVNKIVITTRISMLIFAVTAISLGYGLLGLGLASLLSSLVGRGLALVYFIKMIDGEAKAGQRSSKDSRMVRTLWHNASRLGVVQVGAFLIQRANVLLASSYLGLAAAASYGMTVAILIALSGFAAAIAQIRMPHLAKAQILGDNELLKALYGEILIVSSAVFSLGFVALIFLGEQLFTIISSQTQLLPALPFSTLGLIMFLELNHSQAATYLTSTNNVEFMTAGLVSGIIVVILSLIFVSGLGVWGLILSQGIVQLSFNNWKWPFEALKQLNSNLSEVICLGAKRLALNI